MTNMSIEIAPTKDLLGQTLAGGAYAGLKFCSREDAVRNVLRSFNIDVGETGMYLRQLEHILAAPFMTEYAEVKFRSILPVSNEVPNGANSWTYRQTDEFGKAQLITDFSADFPSVDVQGVEKTNAIKSFGTSYHYSIQELRNSAFGGLPLETMRATAAHRVMDRLFDQLAAVGNTSMGFSTGFANAAGILTRTKGTQAVGTTWQDSNGNLQATPNEILDDVHGMCRKIFETTIGLHQANELLVGTKGYALLASKPQSPAFTDQSLMSYILRMSPWIKSIKHWAQLDTAGSGSKERILVHEKSPEVARVMIAQEFEQFPPLPVNLSFKVLCHARFAGVAVFKPAAICYMDGTEP